MQIRPIFIGLLLCILLPAQASDKCAQIADNRQRLECYDLEYRKEATVSIESAWIVKEEVSRIDDSKNVFLTVFSKDSIRARFGSPAPASLHIHCRENTTMLYIVMAGNFLSDIQDYGQVTYRIDTAPAGRTSMDVSTDNAALGLWSGRRSIPFIRSMFGGSNLLIRITPFNESTLTVDFPIQGLEEAIQPLRAACNW